MSQIEDKVCAAIQRRAAAGLQKYGVTVERTDLNLLDWLQHLQEELFDAAVYIERLKSIFELFEIAMLNPTPEQEAQWQNEKLDCFARFLLDHYSRSDILARLNKMPDAQRDDMREMLNRLKLSNPQLSK